MSDQTITIPAAIASPGMRVQYHVNLDGENQKLFFEAALDQGASRSEIDDLFDRMSGATARLKAQIDLVRFKAQRDQARNSIPRLQRELAKAESARDSNIIAMSKNRNSPVAPAQHLATAAKDAETYLQNAKFAAEAAAAMIPYLEAVIRGEDPGDLPMPETKTWDREPAENLVSIEPLAAAE